MLFDDTLLQRWGRKVWGCFYHRDATANSEKAAVAWGNNWAVIGICVRLPMLERTVCLPVLFRLWQPRRPAYAKADKRDPQRPGKPVMAREMVCLLAARLPGRRIDVVGDAAYASEAWRGVDTTITVTSRLRSNAAIYAPAPERTGKRGRPRKWGPRLERLAEIATDTATEWVEHTVCRYGNTETLMLHVIDCLWEPLGPDTPVRVILIQATTKPAGYQLALITTDLTSTPAQIVERYCDRWAIEVCFEEAKHQAGVGDAENRGEKAVTRTVPFQFLTMTWRLAHHPTRPRARHLQQGPRPAHLVRLRLHERHRQRAYAASKAAVEQLGRALRTELSIHGASAGVLYPGWVATGIATEALGGDPIATALRKHSFKGPLGKAINPDRIAAGVLPAIERRAARVTIPRRWIPISLLCGIINPIIDAAGERDRTIARLLNTLEDHRSRATT